MLFYYWLTPEWWVRKICLWENPVSVLMQPIRAVHFSGIKPQMSLFMLVIWKLQFNVIDLASFPELNNSPLTPRDNESV